MPTFHVYKERSLAGSVTGANLSEVESIIAKYYKEMDSFSGSGAKLGGGTSGGTAAPNPFHALFLPNINKESALDQNESEVVDCEIQLRLWDGSSKKATFPSNATIQKVADYVSSLPQAPNPFYISTQYPKRVYQGDLLQRTLRQENLIKRGQLIISLNP